MAEGGLLGHDFLGPSWDRWRAVLKAAWAEPLTAPEMALFREVAERDPPTRRVRELWAIAGRRAGKDSTAAAIAVSAALEDYRPFLRTGERATIACLATSRDQATIIHRYVTGYFASIPVLKSLVARETDDTLELHNRVEIVISTNNFRAIRGRTIACAVLDEVAFFRDDGAASSDVDLYAALEPAMATIPTSIMVGISSPYRRKGLLFDKWRQHYGKPDDDVLVIRAPSRTLNPTLPQRIVDARMEVDPEAAASEYLAEWREGISDLFDRALIEAAVDDIAVRPPRPDVQHMAFVDVSGGRGSSFALAVAHGEGDMVIVDAVMERRAPFDPGVVVKEAAAVLREYGIGTVIGDAFGGGFPPDAFAAEGIDYIKSDRDKSRLFLDCLPLFAAGRIRLLNNTRLVHQFALLERRTTRAGRDMVGPPAGGADDLANAVAGAAVNVVVDRPALVKPRVLLGDRAVPAPNLAHTALATTVVGQDGMCATAYFVTHNLSYETPGPRLVLMDVELGPLTVATTHHMATRLVEVVRAIPNRPYAWVAYVQPGLSEQMSIDGYACSVYGPDEKLDDPHQLAINMATHVNSGQFRVCETAAAKATILPLVSALSFQPAERIESSPLRMAILYGVAIGLRRA